MQINLFGLTILEPVTFLTDMVVAITAFVVCLALTKNRTVAKPVVWWLWFFLLLGLSTIIGGFAHALVNYTGKTLQLISWGISGFSILAVEITVIMTLSRFKKLFSYLIFLQFILFLFFLLWKQNFVIVKINSIIGIGGIVFISHIIKTIKDFSYKGRLIMVGILILSSTVFVHGLKLSFSKNFNHNDISHLIMALSLFVIFRGVKNLYEVKTGRDIK